jgi:hypothetical protein
MHWGSDFGECVLQPPTPVHALLHGSGKVGCSGGGGGDVEGSHGVQAASRRSRDLVVGSGGGQPSDVTGDLCVRQCVCLPVCGVVCAVVLRGLAGSHTLTDRGIVIIIIIVLIY